MVPLRLARGWHCRRANIWGETANSESKGVEYCPCAWAEGQSKPIHPGRHFSNTLGRWERNMKVFPKVPSSSRKLSWKIVQKHPICKGKGWGESLRIKGTEILDKRLRKKKKKMKKSVVISYGCFGNQNILRLGKRGNKFYLCGVWVVIFDVPWLSLFWGFFLLEIT